MSEFEFINAASLEEASTLLEERGDGAIALAGGTDALGILKDGVRPGGPQVIVNLKTIEGLDYIRVDGDEVAVGCLTRLHALETDPLIRERYPALADAAKAVGSPQLRNMGTVGGNICQEPRCWYYRYPENYFNCIRKGGSNCNALTGENRFHSLFGSVAVTARPCSTGCPGSVDIPSYAAELRAGRVQEAARILYQQNPLPAVTGRVCPHYCEEECNRGLWDEAVSVRAIERHLGDYALDHMDALYGAPPSSGTPVAVVGAGPAGLACAFYLRQAGRPVTVFEKRAEAGGMLRYAIPAYRLPLDIVRRQTAALEQMGVDFRYGTEVGRDVQLEELSADYGAVFLAPGGWGQPTLGLENEHLLFPGLAFLEQAKEGAAARPGDTVVVIGGGNVAVDVALTAKKLGARQVIMICLETEGEMPALSWEVEEARSAGVEVRPSWGPARVLASGGRLSGLELKRCSSVFDQSGAFCPVYEDSVRDSVAADRVFLAIGQRAELGAIDRDGRLRGGHSWVQADDTTQATALPGVFAGGDVASGPSTVIAAIAAGRRAAEAILEQADSGPDVGRHSGLGGFNAAFLQKTARATVPQGPESLGGPWAEEASTMSWEAVEHEANRCFNCGCVAVSPSDLATALVALGARVKTTRRILGAEEFFSAGRTGSTVLAPGELVVEIRLPRLPARSQQAFKKFRLRNAIDFPIVNVATVVATKSGKVAEARIAMGSVAPVILRASGAEAYVVGRELSEQAGREAAELAVAGCMPLGRNGYKVSILRALVARALLASADGRGKGP
jgi:NADPH-dependent glutamate synthase beta subunit-like oxidoreductase/CO/xanthine dehydrogenase FAD-binding subunit